MPYFVILDSTANLVDSFDDEAEARHVLEGIVHQDPDAADEYALIPYGEDGMPCGPATIGSELAAHTPH